MASNKLTTWALAGLMAASTVGLNTGCKEEYDFSPEPEPFVPNPLNKYGYLFNQTGMDLDNGGIAFGEYIETIYYSDPELFQKLAEIGNDPYYKKNMRTFGNVIPEWKSNPRYAKDNSNSNKVLGNFTNKALELLKKYDAEILSGEAVAKDKKPPNTGIFKQVSDDIKNVLIEDFYNDEKSDYFPFNKEYVRDCLNGKIISFSNNIIYAGDWIRVGTCRIGDIRFAEALTEEGLGHGTGVGESAAAFYRELIVKNKGPTDKIESSNAFSKRETAFFWNFIKRGLPIEDLIEAVYTSDQALNDLCDNYLIDGVTFKQIRKAMNLFYQARGSPEIAREKTEQLNNELQKLAQKGFSTNSFNAGAQMVNVFLMIFDPNDVDYIYYKPPCNTSAEAVVLFREAMEIVNEIAEKYSISPIKVGHWGGNMPYEMDYPKMKAHIEELYETIMRQREQEDNNDGKTSRNEKFVPMDKVFMATLAEQERGKVILDKK